MRYAAAVARRWAALGIALGAACAPAGRGSSPASRAPSPAPRAPSQPWVAAPVPVPASWLLDRPHGLEPFEVAAVRDVYGDFQAPEGRMPDEQPLPALLRPAAGGEALALADLALARGDAFDASAQYRALLPTADPTALDYANLQLARAYLALGDRERATAVLRELAGATTAVAWVALVELADLRASEIGGVAAARELAPRAGHRSEQLADHLIHDRPEGEAAVLLVDKAVRLNECRYAVQALSLDPSLALENVRGCRAEVELVRRDTQMRARSQRIVAFYERLEPFVDLWDELADVTRAGNRDAEPWVAYADELSQIWSYAEASNQTATLSGIVRSALIIATELSLARLPPDERQLARIRAISDRLHPYDREWVHRRIGALLAAYRAP